MTAPISGLLESFDVKVHDMMAVGSVAAVISGAGNKSVAFSVSERVREGLHPGDAMTVEKNGTEYNLSLIHICQQTFLALGQAKISVFLALLRKVILLIPLAILLPKLGMGTDGLFYAEPIADLIAIATTVIL